MASSNGCMSMWLVNCSYQAALAFAAVTSFIRSAAVWPGSLKRRGDRKIMRQQGACERNGDPPSPSGCQNQLRNGQFEGRRRRARCCRMTNARSRSVETAVRANDLLREDGPVAASRISSRRIPLRRARPAIQSIAKERLLIGLDEKCTHVLGVTIIVCVEASLLGFHKRLRQCFERPRCPEPREAVAEVANCRAEFRHVVATDNRACAVRGHN